LDGGGIDGAGLAGVDSFAEQGLIQELLVTWILGMLAAVASLSLDEIFFYKFV
jgi:hypothetical protein